MPSPITPSLLQLPRPPAPDGTFDNVIPVVQDDSRTPAALAIHQRSFSNERRSFIAKNLPVNEQARFGIEAETIDIQCSQELPKGTRLINGQNYQFETDINRQSGGSNFEGITAPLSDQEEILSAVQGIKELGNAAHKNYAGEKGEPTQTQLSRLAPLCEREVDIKIYSPYPVASLQVTHGVKLGQEREALLESGMPEESVAYIGNQTDLIGNHYAAQGVPLKRKVAGLLDLVNYYLLQASYPTAEGGTVHQIFPMMVRSPFSLIYRELLNDEEKKQVEKLFVRPSPSELPPLMKILGYQEDQNFFKHPYLGPYRRDPDTGEIDPEKFDGPKIIDVLDSIVNAERDLLSPLEGYQPGEYAMGKYGVDKDKGAYLVERRGGRLRPDVVPMNRCLEEVVDDEFLISRKFDLSLKACKPDASERDVPARQFLRTRCHFFAAVKDTVAPMEKGARPGTEYLQNLQALFNEYINGVRANGLALPEELWKKLGDFDKILQTMISSVEQAKLIKSNLLNVSKEILAGLWEMDSRDGPSLLGSERQ